MLKKIRDMLLDQHDPSLQRRRYAVDVYDETITLYAPDGAQLRLDITDLTSVAIRTNDWERGQPRFWWHLEARDQRLVLPTGASGEAALVDQLQKLPGFDNEQVQLASSSSKRGVFLCWLRDRKGADQTVQLQP